MLRFNFLRPAALLLAAVAALVLSERASAEERRHYSRGTAEFISPTEFVGSGWATHLGRYTEVGSVDFTPTDNPAILQIDGILVYTAANGDQLFATVTGQLNGMTGQITATVTYDSGTGQFEDAVGSSTLAGQILPSGAISVTVKGVIDF